jgi:hypothetical protein
MDIFNPDTAPLIQLNENNNFILTDLESEIEDGTISFSKMNEKNIPAFESQKSKNSSIEEIDEDESEFYVNKREEESLNKIFQVEARNDSSSTNSTNKKRGRMKKKQNTKYKREHTRDSPDNILRKIQVHFLNFIVYFLNFILKNFNFKQKFMKLDYEFKKGIKKELINILKSKSIGELISKEISNKYKNKDKNHNKKIYEEVKNYKVINKILSINYLEFFKNIYFQNKKHIDLREYGLDEKIQITDDSRMFKDLINKNKNDKQKIYQSIKINYLPELIFLEK